jgi:Flp pilus assembly pilin Flp
MESIASLLRELVDDERGATVIEYALVAAVFALGMLTVLSLIQTETGSQLTTTQNNLQQFELNPP